MAVTDAITGAVAHAERLSGAGRTVDAVDLLVRAAAEHGADGPLALALTDLRHEAASLSPDALRLGSSRLDSLRPDAWPPPVDDPFPGVAGLPEIAATDLDATTVAGGIGHHGALVVRGLLDQARVDATVADLERMWDHQRRFTVGNRRDPWYRPFPTNLYFRRTRQAITAAGGTWLADSPACFTQMLATLAGTGVVDVVADHLGTRPIVTLQKMTARRAPAEEQLTYWHQDGSFFQPGVRTVNLWVAFTRCGGDEPVPCLEVVPRRVPELLPAECELGPDAIEFHVVEEVSASAAPVRPAFEPGDALLFDQLFVHRSFHPEGLTGHRDYLECWFFPPSQHPPNFVPFLV